MAASSLPSNLKIMPLGDSITVGGTNAGYRGPLYNLLSATAPGFQFVGASTSNPGSLPSNERQHNGYSSYATLDISNNLDGLDTSVYNRYGGTDRNPNGGYWLTGDHDTGRGEVFPDVVLLLVGANDATLDTTGPINLANYRANLTTLVDKIVTLRPDARLIMADITPYFDQISTATTINNAVNTVAAEYLALGAHVSVVDLNTSFPSNGMGPDGVHPNDVGYTWMANQWYGAIRDSYATTPEPSAFALLTSGLVGLAAYAWRKRRNVDIMGWPADRFRRSTELTTPPTRDL
jgi:lysophospholipase L1-like esterase